jgi:hypothetical protein
MTFRKFARQFAIHRTAAEILALWDLQQSLQARA